jgi:hypothetical protein
MTLAFLRIIFQESALFKLWFVEDAVLFLRVGGTQPRQPDQLCVNLPPFRSDFEHVVFAGVNPPRP